MAGSSDRPDRFHVHPELVDDAGGCARVHLCTTCRAALATPDKAPKHAVSTRDYGLLSRLEGLQPPSTLEHLVLSEVRPYSVTAKVHVPDMPVTSATREVLRGVSEHGASQTRSRCLCGLAA